MDSTKRDGRNPGPRVAPPIPARAGASLKPQHYRDILAGGPAVGFFEIHAENYMGAGGPPHRYLEQVRADHPLSLHGVGLSLASAAPLDERHLSRLRLLADRYEPGLISEHLAWSASPAGFLNDLLPVPCTGETLGHLRRNVDRMQEALGRRVLIENPAAYLRFADADMTELDFLEELAARTGCGLLLDINNVMVSAVNLGFDPYRYIDRFPMARVEEMHLAGHAASADGDGGRLLIDDHGAPVADAVWALYGHALGRRGPVATLVEWDNDVPAWPVLRREAERADDMLRAAAARPRRRETAYASAPAR